MSIQQLDSSLAPLFLGSISEAKILATMPLLFRPERLIYYFDQVRCNFEYDAALVELRIITNTFDPMDKDIVIDLLSPFQSSRFNISIESFWNHDDPKAMTWVHKRMVLEDFLPSQKFSHFIYLEDDIRLSRQNINYFIEDRPVFDPPGFIPSFLRYEYNFKSMKLYTSDVVRSASIHGKIVSVAGKNFVMADNPYCAAYILDQRLAAEYVMTDSFDPERSALSCRWPSTERSAMGLCFENIPAGHLSRFKILMNIGKNIPDCGCLIHHLPNNFTNRDWPEGHRPFGKLEVLKMFS